MKKNYSPFALYAYLSIVFDNSCISYLVISKSQHTLVVDPHPSGFEWFGQPGANYCKVGADATHAGWVN